ncbi:hypothetical protein ACWERI_28925 [Streptomyces collinus]|uniref:hypothetical protein n=1 Tax=Streptomyces collinus TaxID=42684 RepID=UPI00369D283C
MTIGQALTAVGALAVLVGLFRLLTHRSGQQRTASRSPRHTDDSRPAYSAEDDWYRHRQNDYDYEEELRLRREREAEREAHARDNERREEPDWTSWSTPDSDRDWF